MEVCSILVELLTPNTIFRVQTNRGKQVDIIDLGVQDHTGPVQHQVQEGEQTPEPLDVGEDQKAFIVGIRELDESGDAVCGEMWEWMGEALKLLKQVIRMKVNTKH